MKRISIITACTVLALAFAGCKNSPAVKEISGKADKIVLGNIITMDQHKMRAEAMTIKNGMVQYVGSKRVAESLCDEKTVIEDYGTNSVYPGFIDVHVHPLVAGERLIESIDLVSGQTVDEYLELVRQFIEAHPDKNHYLGAGWSPRDRVMTAKDLDAICSDKVIELNSIDGHSYWLNSKALEQYGITREAAVEDGPDRICVDADGNPTGVIKEETERIAAGRVPDIEEERDKILLWQYFAFALGLTTVGDAAFGQTMDLDAYHQLDNEGLLKLMTYASYYDPIPGQSVEDKVSRALKAKADYDGDHFKVTGIKMFVDGVVEGHTAWVLNDYLDQPGYNGVKKMDDHEYLTELVKAANTNGLYVHLHTIGDGAAKFAIDGIEDAQKQTGIYDARNCMAHLQLVAPEDIKRMADNNIIAIVAPLWTPFDSTVTPLEIEYIGLDKVISAYPIRSFIDNGAVVAFHSDYPVSTFTGIPLSVTTAVERRNGGQFSRQPEVEGITRLQALEAMTTNPAYALGDSSIGDLSTGKKANYAVFNADFLSDPLDKVHDAEIVATAVEGEVVYPIK